jgi:hypothetical protein
MTDLRGALEILLSQKAQVDYFLEQANSLSLEAKQAESLLTTLREERRMADRIRGALSELKRQDEAMDRSLHPRSPAIVNDKRAVPSDGPLVSALADTAFQFYTRNTEGRRAPIPVDLIASMTMILRTVSRPSLRTITFCTRSDGPRPSESCRGCSHSIQRSCSSHSIQQGHGRDEAFFCW